jgi:hypothetical protein
MQLAVKVLGRIPDTILHPYPCYWIKLLSGGKDEEFNLNIFNLNI